MTDIETTTLKGEFITYNSREEGAHHITHTHTHTHTHTSFFTYLVVTSHKPKTSVEVYWKVSTPLEYFQFKLSTIPI